MIFLFLLFFLLKSIKLSIYLTVNFFVLNKIFYLHSNILLIKINFILFQNSAKINLQFINQDKFIQKTYPKKPIT